MIKKILSILILLIAISSIYLLFFFNVNDYKTTLEAVISKRANVELTIKGDLTLDAGINTDIKATNLIIKKK